jgi:UDP-N-acetylmuramyl tripeptide synthase
VRSACEALGWPAPQTRIHRHGAGAILAFTAPADQLFTATEVNEWAWLRALAESGHAIARPCAPGSPALDDEGSALATLEALAAAEASPALRAAVAAAEARGLPCLLDDATLTLGAGKGSRSWPREAPPSPEAVPWDGLHGIPTVLVTGSNGKTTTVRLLAALAEAHGWTCGHCCTDGIVVGGRMLEAGDYSGPGGARTVLRHPEVEAAVLETARGGLLRRGLAVPRAQAAVVTNISADHFGEYGIQDLRDLAEVKLTVAKALGQEGLLVLNADDPVLAEAARSASAALGWFSVEFEAGLRQGGPACGVQDGELLLGWQGEVHRLGAVADMPLTAGGRADYNVANLAAAALAAAALGIAPATLARVFASFGAARGDNPGRLETWRFGSLTVLMDYAHNPDGLAGLLKVARAYAGSGRLGLLLGQAGNREDAAIRALAAAAAAFEPDLVVLKDMAEYLRGRAHGEVPAILAAELANRGFDPGRVRTVLEEHDAVGALLAWARPGDVLVMPIHAAKSRAAVAEMLDGLTSMGWTPGAGSSPSAPDPGARA